LRKNDKRGWLTRWPPRSLTNLYDTAPLFLYTDQLLRHCVSTCSNVRYWLVYCMRWLLWCFCLLAESYETI